MAQAGRPAGTHILPPALGARGPHRRPHGADGSEAGALWVCCGPRGSEERGFVLRGGGQRSRRLRAPCEDLACSRSCEVVIGAGRGLRGSPLWPTRVASTRLPVEGLLSRVLTQIKLPESSV